MFKNIPLDSLPVNLKEEFAPFVKDDPFPIVPVAKLLALSDLKGRGQGGAQVSEKHPNFIVNISNASSADVLGLMEIEKKEILDKYGIELEEEVTIL
jgi:UDP-N-acetylmuramate dehydrogenase